MLSGGFHLNSSSCKALLSVCLSSPSPKSGVCIYLQIRLITNLWACGCFVWVDMRGGCRCPISIHLSDSLPVGGIGNKHTGFNRSIIKSGDFPMLYHTRQLRWRNSVLPHQEVGNVSVLCFTRWAALSGPGWNLLAIGLYNFRENRMTTFHTVRWRRHKVRFPNVEVRSSKASQLNRRLLKGNA